MARAALAALWLLIAAAPAGGGEITVRDGKTQPENLTLTARGDIIVGSFAAARIDIIRRGATTAETFADLSGEGGSILGVLSDRRSGTLWACHFTPGPDGRRSNLRGFDLSSQKQKFRWDLPGFSTCNDVSFGPDRALYIADTNGKIYRLPSGARAAKLVMQDPRLEGVDGIAFLSGMLFVSNIRTGRFYRVERASGASPKLVELTTDSPVLRPDGMRAANNKLFVAEAGSGRLISLTIHGNHVSVSVLKSGLRQPTGVEPAGGRLWYSDLAAGKIGSLPLP